MTMSNIRHNLLLLALISAGVTNAPTATAGNGYFVMNNKTIDIGLSALFAAGGSSVGEANVLDLQGGGHDPNRIGFTIQNIELTVGGAVDPFFDGQANIIYQINEQGETVIELEEVYALSKQLPYGLQLKVGQYFTEFGRLNNRHPHTWRFTDQPIILTRLFGGDGLRSQGARLAWLSPLPWYSEFYVGVQNARGETTASFISDSRLVGTNNDVSNHPINGPEDFLYSFRWLNGIDVSDTISSNLGVSALFGPNSSGDSNRTQITGMDLYVKWQAETSQAGFPFIAWHSEYIMGHYNADTSNQSKTWKDNGWFSQLSYGYKKGWVAGVRFEQADSNIPATADSNHDNRTRTALNLTWFPTEFSKLRLQYNADKAAHLPKTVHSIWLQMEINLGTHAAHTF